MKEIKKNKKGIRNQRTQNH